MPSQQDAFIFCTGIVGRAMGSGKFTAEDILKLTEAAYNTFITVMGKPEAPSAYQVSPVAGVAHFSQAAQGVVAAAGVPPETKSFEMWGGDKAYLGWKDAQFEGMPEPEVTWGHWFQAAQSGNEKAVSLLQKASQADPKKGDPKWHNANARRIARAKALLLKLGK